MDAVVQQTVFVTDDLAHHGRWSEFGKRAASELGVRSMLCYRMYLEEPGHVLAGLNVYSRDREATACRLVLRRSSPAAPSCNRESECA